MERSERDGLLLLWLLLESNMTKQQTTTATTTTTTIAFSNWFWCGWLNWCYDSGCELWLISIFVYFKHFTCNGNSHTCSHTHTHTARLFHFCESAAATATLLMMLLLFLLWFLFVFLWLVWIPWYGNGCFDRPYSVNMVKCSPVSGRKNERKIDRKEKKAKKKMVWVRNVRSWCEAIRKP